MLLTRWHVCIYTWNLTMENRKDPWGFLAGIIKEKGSKLQFSIALIVLYWTWPMLYSHVERQITDCWFCYCSSEDRVMIAWQGGSQGSCHSKTTLIMRDFNSSHLDCISIITVINVETWGFFFKTSLDSDSWRSHTANTQEQKQIFIKFREACRLWKKKKKSRTTSHGLNIFKFNMTDSILFSP